MSCVIIGAGPNGLAAAFYMARAGRRPIVLEQSASIGGGAVTGEIQPGFHCPTLSHEVLLHARVVRDMRLGRHGLEWLHSDIDTCSLSTERVPLTIFGGHRHTSDALRVTNQQDADAWLAFQSDLAGVTSLLGPVLSAPPPAPDQPAAGDLLRLLNAGRRFRGLGSRRALRLLRWLPMPIGDFVDEWFDDELLKATIASEGLTGTSLGPRSAGSTLVMFLRQAHRRLAGGRPLVAKGGPGAVTQAMAAAARAAGADIRERSRVERIVVHDGAVTGVVVDGREIAADLVLSAIDPRSTFLSLIDATAVDADILAKIRNVRASGTVAKVNLALGALPRFTHFGDTRTLLTGRIHIGPDRDYLERASDHAKYGEVSTEPWLDVSIPSVLDPSLAPSGAHVASIYVHCAPRHLRTEEPAAARQHLLHRTLTVLERHAPGISPLVVKPQVLLPVDLEAGLGLSGGHIFHGELAPDQLYAMRPIPGLGRYATPIRGLYLCSAGTHPGGFLTGASGRLAALQASDDHKRRRMV